MKSWIYRWGPAVLIMAIIFFASATPGSDLPKFGSWDFLAKKGGHMFGYALLALAYLRAIGGKMGSRTQLLSSLALAILYACSDEWHQRFIPGRTSSITDVLIDATGAVIGLAISYLVRGRLLLNKTANT
jgi:VanZ family protein